MTTKERLVEKTMKDMLETLSGVEKYVLVEKIVDLQQRIDKANQLIEKQKKKMYKSRNKIAMYILINLENILRGDE